MTRYSGVTTSTRGEAAPGRKKGRDNASWADANPAVDSVAIIRR
jgi:hypothetical protein